MTVDLILFLILALVSVSAALGMLLSRNTVYSALFLVLNFVTVAVFYLLLGAPVVKKKNGIWMTSLEDVNRDGFLDLVFHVSTSALQLNNSSTEAFLYARTQDGILLVGVDAVRIVH